MTPMEQWTVGALGFFVLKELISWFRTGHKEQAKALQENTLALTELKVELRHMQRALEDLPKMRSDINFAHQKIRELSKGGRDV